MDGWDHVFRTGEHTDGNGKVKTWTTDDLDKIVASFNPTFHEPPLVIGHPSDNAPAFGWVEGIKRVGNNLYLKYHDVADEFKDWTARGLFKKKSIALYPNGSLRHIAYMGAMPPAIKGLPNYQFNDGDRGSALTYEFSDWRMSTMGRIIMRIRDYLVEKEGAEKADTIINSWEVQDLLTPPPEDISSDNSYHEEVQMKPEEVKTMIDDALKGQAATFSEQLAAITKENAALKTELTAIQTGQVAQAELGFKREFSEFLMTPAMQKRIPEGQRAATVAHMVSLAAMPAVEFGEGDQKKTITAVDSYKEQLGQLPEVVQFGESATRDKVSDLSANGMDADAIAKKAVEFKESEAKAGRDISVTEAVSHVTKKGA